MYAFVNQLVRYSCNVPDHVLIAGDITKYSLTFHAALLGQAASLRHHGECFLENLLLLYVFAIAKCF